MTCDHCDEDFDSKRERIVHMLEEHDDELTSHKRDQLERELNDLEEPKTGPSFSMESIPVKPIAGILLFGAVIYGVVASGLVDFNNRSGDLADGENATIGALGSTHEHAQISIILDGNSYSLNKPHFHEITPEAHIHTDGEPNTLHKEATGVTYGYFLDTWGWEYNETCITTHEDETFCEGGNRSFSFELNGEQIEDPSDHVLEDGERFVIRHG